MDTKTGSSSARCCGRYSTAVGDVWSHPCSPSCRHWHGVCAAICIGWWRSSSSESLFRRTVRACLLCCALRVAWAAKVMAVWCPFVRHRLESVGSQVETAVQRRGDALDRLFAQLDQCVATSCACVHVFVALMSLCWTYREVEKSRNVIDAHARVMAEKAGPDAMGVVPRHGHPQLSAEDWAGIETTVCVCVCVCVCVLRDSICAPGDVIIVLRLCYASPGHCTRNNGVPYLYPGAGVRSQWCIGVSSIRLRAYHRMHAAMVVVRRCSCLAHMCSISSASRRSRTSMCSASASALCAVPTTTNASCRNVRYLEHE